MHPDTLQQFARQIHAWADEELRSRPGPFRTVDLSPPLLGHEQLLTPPIVFWINRDSHLAGGVILLPKHDPEGVSATGEEVCTALGLDSYCTWGVGEVAEWQVGATPGRIWAEPLPASTLQAAADFRRILQLLLQKMYKRFFERQQSLPLLSPLYLANLLQQGIESARPAAAATLGQASARPEDIEPATRRLLAGVILQLATIACHQSFPAGVRPDALRPALMRAIDTLPPALVAALKTCGDIAGELPDLAWIRLHHLGQRLQQLGPDLTAHLPAALTRLIAEWNDPVQHPLPLALKKNNRTCIVNPDRYHPEISVVVEIAPPPFGAATALLRQLQSPKRHTPLQLSDPLGLQAAVPLDAVIGSLGDRSRPDSDEQKRLAALLRRSWPNRNLKLAGTAPRWAWQAIHLFGLLQESPHIVLTLPADWLWLPYGAQLLPLLCEQAELNGVTAADDTRVRLEFNRPGGGQQVTVTYDTDDLRLLDNQSHELSCSDLLLALSLPADSYDLLRSGELSHSPVLAEHDALGLFLRASIGRGLWQLLAPGRPLPKHDKLAATVLRTRMPLPSRKTLDALGRLLRLAPSDPAAIDRELEAWLGTASRIELSPRFRIDAAVSEGSPGPDHAALIADELMRSGQILAFPHDYLYSISEQSRRHYSLTGPLRITESFFDSYTLAAPDGTTLQVEGVATSRALQLIAMTTPDGTECELPTAETDVDRILQRYLQDLRQLLQQVRSAASAPDYSGSTGLVPRIWERLPVPPLSAIDGE